MGRYFQHAGFPLVNQELSGGVDIVNESAVVFHSSGGVHLLHARIAVLNGTAGSVSFLGGLFLDGVAIALAAFSHLIHNTATGIIQATCLLEIPAGPHTLDLRVDGSAAALDTVTALTGAIFAVEFAAWEAADRIE